jgi:hypothetical protein
MIPPLHPTPKSYNPREKQIKHPQEKQESLFLRLLSPVWHSCQRRPAAILPFSSVVVLRTPVSVNAAATIFGPFSGLRNAAAVLRSAAIFETFFVVAAAHRSAIFRGPGQFFSLEDVHGMLRYLMPGMYILKNISRCNLGKNKKRGERKKRKMWREKEKKRRKRGIIDKGAK